MHAGFTTLVGALGVALCSLLSMQGCSSAANRPSGFQSGVAGGGSAGESPQRSSVGGERASGGAGADGSSGAVGEAGAFETPGAAGASDDGTAGPGAAGAVGASASGGESGLGGGAGGSPSSAVGGAAGGDPGPVTVCGTTAHWLDSTELPISTGADDQFGSLTPDELSVAWTISVNDTVTVEYADRGSIASAFTSPKQLTGAFASDRAALSPDGLALVLVNADRRGFTEYTRATRGDDFAEPGVGQFAAFDAYAQDSMVAGMAFADPLLAADDKTFIYSEYGSGVTDTVHQTKRLFSGDAWLLGSALIATELEAQGDRRRRPTGLSVDGRTLFFWDTEAAQERAGFLAYQSDRFADFVDLGPLLNAQPNADCTRLYHSGPGKLSVDLFVATAE